MEQDDPRTINIAISGWPGSGTTSFAVILAYILKRKYFYIGDIFRYLTAELGKSTTGKSQIETDNYLEVTIGHTVDAYIDHKLITDENLIIESDITAFRLGHNPKIYSIFLKASLEERLRRVKIDGREDGEKFLAQRDSELADRYRELHGIEYFSEEMIAKKYNLVMDNSNMSIQEELEMALADLNKYYKFEHTLDKDKLQRKIEIEVEKFNKYNKQGFKKRLMLKGLYFTPEEILRDITKTLPEDVTQFPEDIKNLFIGKKL